MILRTDDVKEGEFFPLEGELPPEALDLKEDNLAAKDPVAAKLTVQREGNGGLVITGSLATTVRLCCGRCLDWIDWPLEVKDFCMEVEPPLDLTIDLTPRIREDILLQLPFNSACRLDADHRCPYSGKSYPPETDAPPSLGGDVWQALDKLEREE